MTTALEDGEMEFRETMLHRLTDPKDRAALLRIGRMLNTHCLDVAPSGGGLSAVRVQLQAAGRDLRHLQRYLAMVARERSEKAELGTSSIRLEDIADSCSKQLGCMTEWIERELRE
jgi:hypothetical protein